MDSIDRIESNLKLMDQAGFRFAVGDVVRLSAVVIANGPSGAPMSEARLALSGLADGLQPHGIVTIRRLEQCHGGVQRTYFVRVFEAGTRGNWHEGAGYTEDMLLPAEAK